MYSKPQTLHRTLALAQPARPQGLPGARKGHDTAGVRPGAELADGDQHQEVIAICEGVTSSDIIISDNVADVEGDKRRRRQEEEPHRPLTPSKCVAV
jgi:hypothetical protein